jgi:iron complex outermembrane receptor protein
VRVSRTFTEGPRLHRFHASVRARDQARLYGEAEAVELSRRDIMTRALVAEPAFAFVERTPDDVRQVSGGIPYEGCWSGRGSINIGIQKTGYRKGADRRAGMRKQGRWKSTAPLIVQKRTSNPA